MSVFNIGQPIVIPDPEKDVPQPPYTPSGCNVSVYAVNSQASIETGALSNGAFPQVYQLNRANYPNSNSTYEFKCNWFLPAASFSNVPNGQLYLQAQYGVGNTICQSGMYVNDQSWSLDSNYTWVGGSMSAIFKNNGSSDQIALYFINNSGEGMSNATINFNSMSVTGVTLSNYATNNFSNASF